MAQKEMESNKELTTGGKPVYIELPSRHESPGRRASDTSCVPLCHITMLIDVAGL